jgi:hypothetical protein
MTTEPESKKLKPEEDDILNLVLFSPSLTKCKVLSTTTSDEVTSSFVEENYTK